MDNRLYEVWESDGHGTHVIARFKLLQDAIRYVFDRQDVASCAIREPSGSWYEQPGRGKSVFTRRKSSRPPPPRRHAPGPVWPPR